MPNSGKHFTNYSSGDGKLKAMHEEGAFTVRGLWKITEDKLKHNSARSMTYVEDLVREYEGR